MFEDLMEKLSELDPIQLTCLIATFLIGVTMIRRSRKKQAKEHRKLGTSRYTSQRKTNPSEETRRFTSKDFEQDKKADDATIYLHEHPETHTFDDVDVRLHNIERTVTARLDTKIAALQQLMIQVDQAMQKLAVALDAAEQVGLLDQNPLPRREVDQPVSVGSAKASRPARGEHTPPAAPHIFSGRISLPPKLDDDPRFERVYALADSGFSATKIAAQTGMQIGEVELILSVRPRQQA